MPGSAKQSRGDDDDAVAKAATAATTQGSARGPTAHVAKPPTSTTNPAPAATLVHRRAQDRAVRLEDKAKVGRFVENEKLGDAGYVLTSKLDIDATTAARTPA